MQIEDTYKAAYLMTRGARLVDITFRKVGTTKGLYRKQWICHLEDVPEGAINNWNFNQAVVNVADFRRERLRIKKLAKSKFV